MSNPVYSDTPSAKIAKTILTKITNNQNLGGIKLIRGYQEIENEKRKKNEAEAKKVETQDNVQPSKKQEDAEKDPVIDGLTSQENPRISLDSGDLSRKIKDMVPQKKKELDDIQMTKQQAEDYDNEESEEDIRGIDQVIFVIHGIGQQMSERMGENFVHGM
jgi:hypothetical protein